MILSYHIHDSGLMFSVGRFLFEIVPASRKNVSGKQGILFADGVSETTVFVKDRRRSKEWIIVDSLCREDIPTGHMYPSQHRRR